MSPDLAGPVLIVWKDHEDHTSAEWLSYEDTAAQVSSPMALVRSVGWIYHENKEAVSLVSTIGPDECSGVLRIIKRAIVHRLDLKDDSDTMSP